MRGCAALALSLLPCFAAADAPRLKLSAHHVVTESPSSFGGLSGIEITDNGKGAQVLADTGTLFYVALLRDDHATLDKVAVLSARYFGYLDPGVRHDTEGLAIADDGTQYVSSEEPNAVAAFDADRSWSRSWEAFQDLGISNENRGLEALAIDPMGRLVTLPEVVPPGQDAFPVFRQDADGWRIIATLQKQDAFNVVGADFGPEGQLYVLERAVSLLGFRSRIRVLSLGETTHEPITLWDSRLGRFDNLEGISVWSDTDGNTRITLVSDNNFLSVQRTEFVEFILDE